MIPGRGSNRRSATGGNDSHFFNSAPRFDHNVNFKFLIRKNRFVRTGLVVTCEPGYYVRNKTAVEGKVKYVGPS
jgi:hypothetical protein